MLNFGVRDVAGDFAAKDRAQLIRKSIAQAIENFEPRIRKGSAQVEMRSRECVAQHHHLFRHSRRYVGRTDSDRAVPALVGRCDDGSGDAGTVGLIMDTRLLSHYECELAFLRDMGAEFAQAYPKIAARLGMEGMEVLDPYVERLLEGTAFLSARVQLALEMQFPAFTSNLLEIVYPHFLAPTPSMMVVAFEPDLGNAGVKEGFTLKRGARLRSKPIEGEQTACHVPHRRRLRAVAGRDFGG